jgi:hypothetical protein
MVGRVNLGTTKGVSHDLTRMEAILASHCIDFCQGHARWGIACHCMSWPRAGSNQGSSHPESLFSF